MNTFSSYIILSLFGQAYGDDIYNSGVYSPSVTTKNPSATPSAADPSQSTTTTNTGPLTETPTDKTAPNSPKPTPETSTGQPIASTDTTPSIDPLNGWFIVIVIGGIICLVVFIVVIARIIRHIRQQ